MSEPLAQLTGDQIAILAIVGGVLILFVGQWIRFDVVAVGGLLAAVLCGVVAQEEAFSGFANPAVITVAAVLMISRALANSGLVDVVAAHVTRVSSSRLGQTLALCVTGAALSAFMNNVGALALLMPVALANARRFEYQASMVLMPLSFATLLGGLMTLIGTPPNLLISGFRRQALGEPYGMFDFAPVGVAVAVTGVAFICLFGWRLIPQGRRGPSETIFEISDYVSELRMPRGCPFVEKTVADLEDAIEDSLTVLGLIRGGTLASGVPRWERLAAGDVLLVRADTAGLAQAVKDGGLELVADHLPELQGEIAFAEAVVRPNAWIRGYTPGMLRLRRRHQVNLIAIARQGQPLSGRLASVQLDAGDILLLQGDADRLPEVIRALGCLPLAGRRLTFEARRLLPPVAIFGGAIVLTSLGSVSAAVAFTGAVLLMLLARSLTPRDLYESVDWPVIVLLGAMIPVGQAIETTGLAQVLSTALFESASDLSPRAALGLVLVLTMTVTPLLNNAATVVIMAPIVIGIANHLGASPDPFLMAVAIGASCDFLTPFGHQNNTLILGPGGYRFADFCRVGLPLDLIVIVVAILAIPLVWPF